MMAMARPFLFGLLFGLGLLVSGMTDPAKVKGFLDITGQWDPSLAFVMGGAVITAAPLFALARRRKTALTGRRLESPPSDRPDRPLVVGAAVFGIGWGITGICPGPALVSLGTGFWPVLAFIGPMIVGLFLSGFLLRSSILSAQRGEGR
jgi:hypothetical protein